MRESDEVSYRDSYLHRSKDAELITTKELQLASAQHTFKALNKSFSFGLKILSTYLETHFMLAPKHAAWSTLSLYCTCDGCCPATFLIFPPPSPKKFGTNSL